MKALQTLAKLYNAVGLKEIGKAHENLAKTRKSVWWDDWDAEKGYMQDIADALGKDAKRAVRSLQGVWEDAKDMPRRMGKFDLFVEEYQKNGHGSTKQDFTGCDLSVIE
jgi:hypothetical protein